MGYLASSFVEVCNVLDTSKLSSLIHLDSTVACKTMGAMSRAPREGSYTRVGKWKILFDHLNPAYFCMMIRGLFPADVLNLVDKVYPSTEVKTIRIAVSAVMDSWVSGT
jgi:hypothetical protein